MAKKEAEGNQQDLDATKDENKVFYEEKYGILKDAQCTEQIKCYPVRVLIHLKKKKKHFNISRKGTKG